MITFVVKTVLLVNFLQLCIEAAEPTNCIPGYFRPVHNNEMDEYTGLVEIPAPPKGVALEITVKLSIAVAMSTKYLGRLQLAQSRQQSMLDVEQGRSLKYIVHFPQVTPTPSLSEIWFNGKQICTGQRASGQIVTTINLSHYLYPPGVTVLNVDNTNVVPNQPKPSQQPPNIYQPPKTSTTHRPTETSTIYQPTQTPTPSTPPAPSISHKLDSTTELECGTTATPGVNFLIAGGEKITLGQYPWLTAIFLVLNPTYKFHCAGSLVTKTHVITAAHCFTYQNKLLLVGELVVSVGRHTLQDFLETGSENRDVDSYVLHPDYSFLNSINADADIAIITLSKKVEYTDRIKPVCLWSGPTSLDYVVGSFGHVVGWGRDEYGNTFVQEPRKIMVPIVKQEECHFSNRDFVYLSSNRTFCAGKRDGRGPCNGDSGTGFVLYDNNSQRYVLRGIVSRSLVNKAAQVPAMPCDLTQYIVYVDVAKHLDWIYQQISPQP